MPPRDLRLHVLPLLLLAATACGDSAKPSKEQCNALGQHAYDKYFAQHRADESRDDFKSQLYAGITARACREEMNVAEVECLMADESECYEKHRPLSKRVSAKVDGWID